MPDSQRLPFIIVVSPYQMLILLTGTPVPDTLRLHQVYGAYILGSTKALPLTGKPISSYASLRMSELLPLLNRTLIRLNEDLQSLLNNFQHTYGTITTFDEYVEKYSGLSERDINWLKINRWECLRERGQWLSHPQRFLLRSGL